MRSDTLQGRVSLKKFGAAILRFGLALAVVLLGLEGSYRIYKILKYGMIDSPSMYTLGAYVSDPLYGKVAKKSFTFMSLDPRLRDPKNGVEGFDKNVTFNSLGYRGKEFRIEKPPGTYRILVLGEDATLGLKTDDDDTWPARLETILQADDRFRKRHGVTTVEVINGAFVGWRSREGLLRLQREGLQFRPDVLLVAFDRNDPYKAMQGRDPNAPILPEKPSRSALLQNLQTRNSIHNGNATERYVPMLSYLRHDALWGGCICIEYSPNAQECRINWMPDGIANTP